MPISCLRYCRLKFGTAYGKLCAASMANGSTVFSTTDGAQRAVIDGAHRWIFTALSLPPASNEAARVLRAGGRYLSWVVSSSRVHSSFTGRPDFFAHSTAAGMKSV